MEITKISLMERSRLLFEIEKRERAKVTALGSRVLVAGDGGIACHELGNILGVCAEAPLPRIALTDEKYMLTGACGIGSMLGFWGLRAVVASPIGKGGNSALQRRHLDTEGVRHLTLRSKVPQTTNYIRRIFAGGHQLAHVEIEERILPADSKGVASSWSAILRETNKVKMLCIVDQGRAGLTSGDLGRLIATARKVKAAIIYEPRTENLLRCRGFGILKINHSQLSQFSGAEPKTDGESIEAAITAMNRSGSESVLCTRGDKGIVFAERDAKSDAGFLVVPKPKKIFDLVAAGDVVTAAIGFCIARGYSLKHAACFAASAAELSLDQRHDKHLSAQFILNHRDT